MSNRSYRRLRAVFLCISLMAGAAIVWLGYAWFGRSADGRSFFSPWLAFLAAAVLVLGVSLYEFTGELERGEKGLRWIGGAGEFLRAFLRNL